MDYRLFIIPIMVMIINQAVKMVIEMYHGNFKFESLLSYGGMPSSHSAVVVSLVTTIGFYVGLNSPEFAIAVIFALIVIRDASGIRWQLGTQGQVINKLVKELPDDREYLFPVLAERFGHRNVEVVIGIIFGLFATFVIILGWPTLEFFLN